MTPEQVNERIAACVARFVALGYTLDEITIQRDVQGEYPAEYAVTATKDDDRVKWQYSFLARERQMDEPDDDIDIGDL